MASGFCRPCYQNTTIEVPCTVATSQTVFWIACYPFGRWNRSFPLNCNQAERFKPLWVTCREIFNPITNATFWLCGPQENGLMYPSIPCHRFKKFPWYNETWFSRRELVAYTVMMALMAFLTLLLNTTVISVFVRSKSLRKSKMNYFAVNLAISDVLVALVAEPMWLIHLWQVNDYESSVLSRSAYQTFIDAYSLIDLALLVASLANLAFIALERCIIITRPFWYRSRISSRHVFAALVIPWLYASVIVAVEWKAYWAPVSDMNYLATNFSVGFGVPASVVLMSYLVIFVSSRKSFASVATNSQEQQQQYISKVKEIKLATRLFGLFLIFMSCWLPFFTWRFLSTESQGQAAIFYDHRVLWAFKFLSYFNSAINSLIFVIIRRSFLLEIRKILSCKSNHSKRIRPFVQEKRMRAFTQDTRF